MSGLGDAYAAMQPPRKCICGEYPQGHPSGLCDACVAKRSAPPERRPCAGWVREDGRWSLRCGSLVAMAYDPRPGREVQGWAVEVYRLGSANHGAQADGGYVATHDEAVPARIAAEDALRAIAAEILRAVGP